MEKVLLSDGQRRTPETCAQGMGSVLKANLGELLVAEVDETAVTTAIRFQRRRAGGNRVESVYQFEVVSRIPQDDPVADGAA